MRTNWKNNTLHASDMWLRGKFGKSVIKKEAK